MAVSTWTQQRTAATTAATEATEKYLSEQKAEQMGVIGEIEALGAEQEAIPELRKRLGAELGISGLQEQLEPLREKALGLGTQLRALPEDIVARTRGAMLTESQRRQIETAESGKLTRQLADVATAQEYFAGQLEGAEGQLAAQMGDYKDQYGRELDVYTIKLNTMAERHAREATGYNQAIQNELDATLEGISNAWDLYYSKKVMAIEQTYKLALLEAETVETKLRALYQHELDVKYAQKTAGLGKGATPAEQKEEKAMGDFQKELTKWQSVAKQKGVKMSSAAVQRIAQQYMLKYPQYSSQFGQVALQYGGGEMFGGGG